MSEVQPTPVGSWAERVQIRLRPGHARCGWRAWPATARDVSVIAFRGTLIVLWQLLVYGVWACCLPFASRSRLRPVRRRILKVWGRGMLRILGVRLVREGVPPAPPFFLVANHMGYLDIVVLASQTGAVFVAMAAMEKWPLIGFMMRTAHQIFIDRENPRDTGRALKLVNEVIEEGDGIVIFAEARCTRGESVVPFKPGTFEAAARGGWPVHYAALSYAAPPGEPAASDSLVWWRWESAGAQFARMLRLPSGSRATVRFGSAPLLSENRKILAAAAHEAVSELFVPVDQGVLPELPPPAHAPKNVFREIP